MNGTAHAIGLAERIGSLFYLVSPSQSSFATIEEVPDYVTEAFPLFLATIVLEWIVLAFLGDQDEPKAAAKPKIVQVKNQEGKVFDVKQGTWRSDLHQIRLNDGMTSVIAGMIQQLINLLVFRSITLGSYIWMYERIALVSMDPKSPFTWLLGLLCVDFGYYWFHRAAHEVNLLWAAHVVHHSSEDYNLTTALRQSVLQGYFGWVFYLPFATFLPPSVFLVHKHFNLLYQYWIHSDWIPKLGPIEYIMNTPSHHRVHHGSNPYCIDKNYAGTLIIWDRMFGTFQEEVEGTVVYGITHPINTFDPLVIQTHHLLHIFRTAWATPGLLNKVWVFLKGPGWAPGKPRLGLIEEIPHVDRPNPKYNPILATSFQLYAVAQYFGSFFIFMFVLLLIDSLSAQAILVLSGFVLATCSSIGKIFDLKPNAIAFELVRLAVGLALSLGAINGQLNAYLPEQTHAIIQVASIAYSVFFSACATFIGLQAFKPNPLGKDKGPARKFLGKAPASKKK